MSEIKDWSTVAASNNENPPDGWPEGMSPSDVNNSARENMASIRKYYDDPEWRDWGHTIAYGSATTFTTAAGDGDTTSIYHANRRVKANGTLTGTIYGTIQSSSHSTTTTVTVTWDSGSLNNESLTIWVGAAADQAHIPYSSLDGIPTEFVAPSGTKLVFYQASAPTGWTQDATNNDKALRVVSGTGAGTGGTHALSSPPSTSHIHGLANHVHSLNSHTHGLANHVHSLNSHTHSGPSHNHEWYNYDRNLNYQGTWNSGGSGIDVTGSSTARQGLLHDSGTSIKPNADFYTSNESGTTGASTGDTGIASPPNTGASTGDTGASTGDTGIADPPNTGSAGATAFSPQYIDVIVCTKD